MLNYSNVKKFAGLFVLVFTFVVFYLTAERTTSLWDCGEFILAAYKLQVVHPPWSTHVHFNGPLFLPCWLSFCLPIPLI
jgi:hypothetical protein